MKAVQFDQYGGDDVLQVRDVAEPTPAAGRLVVRVRAAAVNPGEIAIREGAFADQWPTTFPRGRAVTSRAPSRAPETMSPASPGDAVLGWSDERASQAELVSVPADHVAAKPDGLSWEVAGSMFVAPVAGYACVVTVKPRGGETVVVSGAAGGAGGVAAQLARRTGARVIGLASEANHDWLREHDIIPVSYGQGQADRIRQAAPDGVDGLLDTFGGGYLDLGIELGVSPDRMNTIIDFDGAGRLGASTVGSSQVASADVIEELAGLAAAGELDVPIAATFPLAEVREAYRQLARRHTRGKIVLLP